MYVPEGQLLEANKLGSWPLPHPIFSLPSRVGKVACEGGDRASVSSLTPTVIPYSASKSHRSYGINKAASVPSLPPPQPSLSACCPAFIDQMPRIALQERPLSYGEREPPRCQASGHVETRLIREPHNYRTGQAYCHQPLSTDGNSVSTAILQTRKLRLGGYTRLIGDPSKICLPSTCKYNHIWGGESLHL